MKRDIVVMGASAGGVGALMTVCDRLPADLDATVFVAMHLSPTAPSHLAELLGRKSRLPVFRAQDGQIIQESAIYVTPPDHHLVLRDGHIELNRGPKENGHRPSIDVLFRSAALNFGPRVIGVVLSGTLDDGSSGLKTIASRGGLGVVQDPDDAAFAPMPANAIAAVPAAKKAPADEIGTLIGELAGQQAGEGGGNDLAEANSTDGPNDLGNPWVSHEKATPSVYTCPECHGTLFKVDEDGFERFRCRVGHGYSLDSLLADQSESLEAAIWTALRTLEERNHLLRRMARRARDQGQEAAADRFEERMRDGDRNADLIRAVLTAGETSRAESA